MNGGLDSNRWAGHEPQGGTRTAAPLKPVGPPSVRMRDQMVRIPDACGPFWPWVISNSTRWFSSRVR